jgi:hypothetical protein
MSVIRIKKARTPYVTLNTTALNDARLSFRAKGLHTYLMSKPDDWQVYIAQLEKESPREGREAVSGALKELETAGYLKRERRRGEKGRMAGWDTTIYETPELAQQDSDDMPATENGLSDIGSTEIGLSEVGSTEVGKTATTYFLKVPSDLKVPKLEGTNPPLPPSGERSTGKIAQAALDAKTVLTHLNTLTGRQYSAIQHISARLHQGVTLAQCLLVLDWWAEVKVPQSPEQAQWFDNETPFRKTKFDKYRAAAEAWQKEGRPPWHGSPNGHMPADTRLSEKGMSTLVAAQRLMERRATRGGQRPELQKLPLGTGQDE